MNDLVMSRLALHKSSGYESVRIVYQFMIIKNTRVLTQMMPGSWVRSEREQHLLERVVLFTPSQITRAVQRTSYKINGPPRTSVGWGGSCGRGSAAEGVVRHNQVQDGGEEVTCLTQQCSNLVLYLPLKRYVLIFALLYLLKGGVLCERMNENW